MNSYEKFLQAMYFVEESEGGTNSDPDDRGGLTNYGISEKQYPHLDIAKIQKSEALTIYYNDYWMQNHCGELFDPLATVLFDSSVNCGLPSAAKWLQATCNKKGSSLKVDGIIGSKTLNEVAKYDLTVLMTGIIAFRLQRYYRLLGRDQAQYKFIRGWINRVADLIFYVM